jgi:hypothetical protein
VPGLTLRSVVREVGGARVRPLDVAFSSSALGVWDCDFWALVVVLVDGAGAGAGDVVVLAAVVVSRWEERSANAGGRRMSMRRG